LESEKPVIDFARVRTFTWVIGVGSPAGVRRGRGDYRPDPAPFPDDQHRPAVACSKRSGGRYRGSATGEVQRLSARGRRAGESPPPRPPVGHRWTISRRRGVCARETVGSGRVPGAVATAVVILRNDVRAVAHLSKSRRAARRMLGVGDHRPAVGRWRSAHLMSALTRL